MKKKNNILKKIANKAYEFGFVSKIKTEIIDNGLNEDVIRLISKKKNEPEWLLEFRLKAYRHWLTLQMPTWPHLNIPPIDYQAISYYADPLKKSKENKNKEIDPELMKTFEKLGIPLEERLALSGTAVDAVMDSVSVKTTFKEDGLDELFAEVISEPAREVLLAHNIPFFAEKTVPAIRNRSGDGFCPMESAVLEIQTPVEALEAIRKTLNALRTPKTE